MKRHAYIRPLSVSVRIAPSRLVFLSDGGGIRENNIQVNDDVTVNEVW